MQSIQLNGFSFDYYKSAFRNRLPEVKSSHLSEALAAGFGYRTYAALQHEIKQLTDSSYKVFNESSMSARFKQLGIEVDPEACVIDQALSDGMLINQTKACVENYFAALKREGLAEAKHNELKGRMFIDVTIEGYRYQGEFTPSGPIIIGRGPGASFTTDSYLGVSSIAFDDDTSMGTGWYVCKYYNQPHLNISGLSPAGMRTLATVFGMAFTQDVYIHKLPDEEFIFYHSKAYEALKSWAKKHPRMANSAIPTYIDL